MNEEKRFVEDHSYLINYDKYCIFDKMQQKHLYLDEVIDLLNELNEEKEQLKQQLLYNGHCEDFNYFDRCSDCIHFESYYFDEYDSDCWCSIFDKLKEDYCEKFKIKQVCEINE